MKTFTNIPKQPMKMKKVLVFILVVFSFTKIFSQDKIITLKGDTISCTIQKVEDNIIYFQTTNNSLTENKTISNEKVAYFMYANIPTYSNLDYYDTVKPNAKISFRFGKSKFTKASDVSMISAELQDFYEKMEQCWIISGQVDFFMTKEFSMGVQYNYQYVNNDQKFNDLYFNIDNKKTKVSRMIDTLKSHFIAPVFTYNKRLFHSKHYISLSAAIGWMIYKDKIEIYTPTQLYSTIKAETVGFKFGAAYEYRFNKYIASGIDFSYLFSNFDSYTVNGKRIRSKTKISLSTYELCGAIKVLL